ncbi:MAG: hypothetical protein ACOYM2_19240 [Rectinemataceae bacterium]
MQTTEKGERWNRIITDWRQSGQAQREYCAEFLGYIHLECPIQHHFDALNPDAFFLLVIYSHTSLDHGQAYHKLNLMQASVLKSVGIS